MTAEAKKILQDALTLPEQERLMVAEELFHSVDDATHAEVDDTLRLELLRRVQQIRNGEVELVAWETVREQGREALAKRRRRPSSALPRSHAAERSSWDFRATSR